MSYGVPNLKEVHPGEGCFSVIGAKKKNEEHQAIFITCKLLIQFSSNLVCKVYMEGINYVNLIEISPVVIEI